MASHHPQQFHSPSSDLGIAEQGLREIASADVGTPFSATRLRQIARETLEAMGLDWRPQ